MASCRFLKPIDKLRLKDLEGRPFWRFAENAEGIPGQDETSVEPVSVEKLCKANPLFVVADFTAADGTKYVGIVQVDPKGKNRPVPCALITDKVYAPLPEQGENMASSVLRYSEGRLGFSFKCKVPITYTLRAAPVPDASPLTETFTLDGMLDG